MLEDFRKRVCSESVPMRKDVGSGESDADAPQPCCHTLLRDGKVPLEMLAVRSLRVFAQHAEQSLIGALENAGWHLVVEERIESLRNPPLAVTELI